MLPPNEKRYDLSMYHAFWTLVYNVKCFHWDTDDGVNDLSGFNGCNTSVSVYKQWRHLHHNWKHFNVSCCLVLNSEHIWISTCWLNLLRAHMDIYMLIELTQSTSEYLHADWTYSENVCLLTYYCTYRTTLYC